MKKRFFSMRPFLITTFFLVAFASVAFSQEDSSFGFGFGDDESSIFEGQSLTVGGKLQFAATQFVGNFKNTDSVLSSPSLGQSTGELTFDAKGQSVDSFLQLKISPTILSGDPARILDEAWLRLMIGDLMLSGGVMKLTWGKADSLRVLDVVNPLDLSDLTISDPKDQKIARPMVHLSVPFFGATLEGVYLTGFEGHKTAWDGPWASKQAKEFRSIGEKLLFDNYYKNYRSSAWATAYANAYSMALSGQLFPVTNPPTPEEIATANAAATTAANTAVAQSDAMIQAQAREDANAKLLTLLEYPETNTLKYSQLGSRLTGSIGLVDLGIQYFWGYVPLPVINVQAALSSSTVTSVPVHFNRYHHVGLDFATVAAGFNLRAEAAANLTSDTKGDDPLVYNQALLWAAGFDRDLGSGVNVNLQGKGSYLLGYENISKEETKTDIEAKADRTSTLAALRISQKLAKDTVEWELAGAWGVEDKDFAIVPAITFTIGEANLRFASRIFGGDSDGQLGQFAKQSYVEMRIKYSF